MLRGVSLRREGAVSPGRQLERQVAVMVREGRLAPGHRLPSTRRLASRIGLHRNTVAAAYRRLAGRGLLEVRHGARARVAGPGPPEDAGAGLAEGGAASAEGEAEGLAGVLAAAAEPATAQLMAAELTAAVPRQAPVEPAVVREDGTAGGAEAGMGPGGRLLVVALPGPAARRGAVSVREPAGAHSRIRARQDERTEARAALRGARPLAAVAVLTSCPRLREALLSDAARIRPGEPLVCSSPPCARRVPGGASPRARRAGDLREVAAGADLVIADRPSAEALCGARPQDGVARPVPARLLSCETLTAVARWARAAAGSGVRPRSP